MEMKEILELVKKIEIIKIRFSYTVEKVRNPYRCRRCEHGLLPADEAPYNKMVRYGIGNEPMCVPCFEELIKQLLAIEV